MFKILEREELNPTVTRLVIEAPAVAEKAKAGQFIILRVDNEGERIPLTIAKTDKAVGSVTVIFQIVGSETFLLNQKNQGDFITDFVGPLGRPTKIEGIKRAIIVGGGVGCAISLPVAIAMHEQGTKVHTIAGFRSKDIVILEKDFREISDEFILMTDDGSYGEKGLVTDALRKLLESGTQFDEVIAIGPVIMMKFVSAVTKEFGVKTSVSMNPIMLDGTGMCGCCRVVVDGELKFACVDGPDFDGHLVDFDRLMKRNTIYKEQESVHYCRVTGKEVRG
ncbi:MAG: sulfide/dihydroorotate dehydrogenase-like FAD/NAD-binding protein [Clostridiales Family XIII bacterium]|nr:sulfide/dihydroorotate dehydrogenase-like FAD/NAD-binding protein [Clostridiales Family XIII bacterium]